LSKIRIQAWRSDDDAQRVRASRFLAPQTVPAPVKPTPENQFAILLPEPGTYYLDALRVPPDWWLRQLKVNGVDSLDLPFHVKSAERVSVELQLTRRHTRVFGTVRTNNGDHIASPVDILIFPTDPRYWHPMANRIKAARSDTLGNYFALDLPPGTYQAALFPRPLAVAERDEPTAYSSFLRQCAKDSVQFVVSPGMTELRQDLRSH
jgi:hypothetical protein